MDFLDDIVRESDAKINEQFLNSLTASLPAYRFCILLDSGDKLETPGQKLQLPPKLVSALRQAAATEQTCPKDPEGRLLCPIPIEELNSIVVCEIPSHLEPETSRIMIAETLSLCLALFHRNRQLSDEKALLLAHKSQRDGKIRVLEKKYQDILTQNQSQSAEYSKLLRSEILRQTSELKKSNQALARAKSRAEAANIAKDKFLANMSHEIRTPMNGVVGMVEILLGTKLSEDQHHFALLMKKSSQALLSVINDILDYSKIEAGKLGIETVDFNLRTMMEEISDIIAISLFEKGLSFACIVESKVPVRLKGDPVRLRQILMNFCGNAVKFTSTGGVVIRVSTLKKTASEVDLVFAVTDTGIGIPKDRIGRLFQSFSQMDESMTRHYGGTGLGLAISKQLAHLMGGKVGVDSEETKGATFWCRLSLQRQPGGEEPPALPAGAGPVLIADPHPASRQVLIEYLTPLNLSFEEAVDAGDACEKIEIAARKGRPFAFVFMDQGLPGGQLAKVLSRVRQACHSEQTVLVVLFSLGHTHPHSKTAMVTSLPKPVKYTDFLACLGMAGEDYRSPMEILPEPGIPGGPYRVLLAEDDEMNRIVAVNLLESLNLQDIQLAPDGHKAFELFCRERFDLILMDGQMPVMSGLEATKKIRSYEREQALVPTPIIALTAHAMKDDRKLFLDSGMDDYLTKPLTQKALADALNRVFGKNLPSPPKKDDPDPHPRQSESFPHAVNLQELREIMNGKASLLQKCISQFSADYKPALKAVVHSIGQNDPEALHKSAHRLKGMLNYLAAEKAAGAALALEDMGRQGRIINPSPLIGLLDASYDKILEQLNDLSEKDGFI